MNITLDWVLFLLATIFMFIAAFSGYVWRAERPAPAINWMCLSFAFVLITFLTP